MILMIKITVTWTMLESLRSVKEMCLSCDHNIFMVVPTGKDAHNPLLVVHLKPSDMEWKEKRSYMQPAKKQQRKEQRKEIQKSNKRKEQSFEGPLLDESWDNWDGDGKWTQDSSGQGASSSSSSWAWRPKNK